jgi:para-nitrobenzyl esterase
MWAWARLQAASGKSAVYYYCFRQQPPFPTDSLYAGWGASHFAELWYVFDHLNQEPWRWSKADRKVAQAISRYWTNFARSGDPNGKGLPSWPAFTNTNGRVLSLGDPIKVADVANLSSLTVLDSVYASVRASPAPN